MRFPKLRYLRHTLFQVFLAPFSGRARRKRMKEFVELAGLREGARVLDLGGTPAIWQYVDRPLDITILNLPGHTGNALSIPPQHKVHFVEGDACNVEQFSDKKFDFVFSNSVIEHVGPEEKQSDFAHQVQRLANAYWVQTPSKWFPLEAHCGMPFWWFYPESLRLAVLKRWKRKLPGFTRMVEGTRVLEREHLETLFPGSRVHVERVMGLPKSYTVFVVCNEPADGQAESVMK